MITTIEFPSPCDPDGEQFGGIILKPAHITRYRVRYFPQSQPALTRWQRFVAFLKAEFLPFDSDYLP